MLNTTECFVDLTNHTIVATARIAGSSIPEKFIRTCLERHFSCDFGVVCDQDKETNRQAIKHGFRVLSAYNLPANEVVGNDNQVWVITDAGHEVTTVLFPSDH